MSPVQAENSVELSGASGVRGDGRIRAVVSDAHFESRCALADADAATRRTAAGATFRAFTATACMASVWQLVAGSAARTRGAEAPRMHEFPRLIRSHRYATDSDHHPADGRMFQKTQAPRAVRSQCRPPTPSEKARSHWRRGFDRPLTSRRRHRWRRPGEPPDICQETAGSSAPASAPRRHPSRIGRRCIACRPLQRRPARR